MKTLKIFFLLFIQAAAAGGEEAELLLPVSLGQNVTLPCYSPMNDPVLLVEWTRPDLVSPEYVFLYRDERSYTSFQHPSFVGRVELRDSQMKGGDVSLILKNVSSKDNGIYECRVSQGALRREKRANIKAEPIRVINLEVEESGAKKGNPIYPGFGAIFILLAILGVIVAGVWKLRKYKTQLSTEDESEKTEKMLSVERN